MAVNQANIFISLESLLKPINKSQFIYGFLDAYGYSKATITRLQGIDSRNIASHPESGEVAFKKGVYFKPVEPGHDIHAIADTLKSLPSNSKDGIRFVIVTDFIDVVAYDLKADERLECLLTALPENYTFFLPLAGFEKAQIYSENPADVRAAESMGRLFDLIKERNPHETADDIHILNVFLTRLLFCFFAEDTGIFSADQVTSAIGSYTSDDGSDVANFYTELFEVLNEPDNSAVRQSKPAYLKTFPYVNGGLFKSKLPVPEFGAKARRLLLDCGSLQWSEINPDIFGSMFQSVIDPAQRGNLGQHYTSVTNIMKVIQPLFLDKLETELESSRTSEAKLKQLLDRISKIKVFDPACGSGNFLIIAYKELRKIEMAVFKALDEVSKQKVMFLSDIKLSQFYGVEIDDFAHEIALLSLWLTEHQMNQAFRNEFGYSPPALPLKDSGNIICDNSLRLDWNKVCQISNLDELYICGNPPFLGKKEQSKAQKEEIKFIYEDSNQSGIIDYVACWYMKSIKYVKKTPLAEVAFVSTNSIIQGEQVLPIWEPLLKEGLKINFGYQTFNWNSKAKGKAAVHVIIVGFSLYDRKDKKIYTSADHNNQSHVRNVTRINPYLIDSSNILIGNRSKSLTKAPKLIEGITPLDNGILSFSENEYLNFVKEEPLSKKWFKPWVTGDSYIYSYKMYCLWMVGITQDEINAMPMVKHRVEMVKKFREESKSSQSFAKTPWLFRETTIPEKYLIIPKTSSENRQYVPMGYVNNSILSSSSLYLEGELYHLGVLVSSMGMDWLKSVGGRLESRYRYSAKLVYNNFPWPDISNTQRNNIELLTEEIILIREEFPDKNLAELYNPKIMPASLLSAHQALDAAVEKLYRDKPFKDSTERIEHLFARYEKLAVENNKKQN